MVHHSQKASSSSLLRRLLITAPGCLTAAAQPFEHFVPIWEEAKDDVLGLVDWLDTRPALAERIARAGQRFACRHLTHRGRGCYLRALTAEYAASVLGYKVTDELLRLRRRQFPGLVEITPEALSCRLSGEGAAQPVECTVNAAAAKPVPLKEEGEEERGEEPAVAGEATAGGGAAGRRRR